MTPASGAWQAVLATSLALAGVGQAVGQESPVEGVHHIVLAPPLDRVLRINIRDERRLVSGAIATFTSQYQMRFAAEGDGWRVTIGLVAVDCVGDDALCSAYQRAMQPMLDAPRALHLGHDLAISGDISPPAAGTDGSGNIATVVAAVDAANPGELGSAELREALTYADMSLTPDRTEVMANGNLIVEGMQQSSIRPDNGGEPVVVTRIRHDEIDPATGLLINAHIITRNDSDQQNPVISNRYWSLTEISGP